MSETTARVLQLLGLLQSRPVWSGTDLAERLGVTTRSVRRDVDRLRELGYPVEAERGVAGGYRLGAGRALPPLLLDQDEAVAVAVCLRLAATGTVAGIGEAAVRTLGKLDQVLPARLRAQVAAVQEATFTLDARGPQVDPDVLLVLARAIRETVQVSLTYVDRSGAETERRLEPYRLAATRNRWYLVGFDLGRDDWRTLRLDRMGEVRATTFRFRPRKTPDLEDYVRRSITQSPYDLVATLEVEASADEVSARIPPSVGTVTALARDRARLVVGADNADAMAVHLMRLDLDFRVLDCPPLQAALRRYAARARRCARPVS
ncbi:YafY family transcriptional regulator [Calidifontibacter sp. DB0510]|uniref:YafY family transcriptional regulator n=1 Tax=Metallococcus carri TaxID=1656884 RepID=A0A967E9P5_9MICO|nr:YafY family protein [Metallococcus carri]NHN55440.1 YafY family transcriptional regulator [Metallococcus carri]NOP38376.1 YafY family transcriptional regulator [Calidifontibacter sp. DB2511S]